MQYSRIEEIDKFYDFLVGLSPKFDVVQGRILGKRLIPSLMEICSEICLKEDCTSAMNISTTPATESLAFSVRSSTSGSERTMENQFRSVIIARNNSIPKSSFGSYMVVPQEVRNALPMTNITHGGRM